MKGIDEVVRNEVRPMCLHGFYVDQNKCIDCANERISMLEKQLKEALGLAEWAREALKLSTQVANRMADMAERHSGEAPK